MGDRERLPADPRRARGPRLLRRSQPGVHGGQVRRLAGGRPRTGRGRQHAHHGDDPDRRSLGAGAHPRTGPRRGPSGRGRRVPAHRRATLAHGRRHGPHPRAQRAGRRAAARRPALGREHGVGARAHVALVHDARRACGRVGLRPGGGDPPGRHAVAGRRGRARSGRGPGAAPGAGAAGVAVRGGRCGRRRGAARGLVATERVRGRSLRRDGRRPGGWRPAAA